MKTSDFLKIKNFKLKPGEKVFTDVEFMSATDKQKIYKNFISFLNNHFKKSLFKRNLYEHFHLHCGFIAHYNLNGFYDEYFSTASIFHKMANNYSSDSSNSIEHKGKKSPDSKKAFMSIYKELNGQHKLLGQFYQTIMSNNDMGGYADYRDLNNAIKEAFFEYIQTWRTEIKAALKEKNDFEKDLTNKVLLEEKETLNEKLLSLQEEIAQIQNELDKKVSKEKKNTLLIHSGQTDIFSFL